GVAGVDSSVGLYESLELAARNDIASFGRNDASSYRLREAEWTANGEDPIAYLHAVGVTHLRGGQSAINNHFDYGKVGFLMGTDHFGIVLRAWRVIIEAYANAVGLLDYVAIGQDISLRVDDHAGAERAFTDGAIVTTRATLAAEKAVKEIVNTAST